MAEYTWKIEQAETYPAFEMQDALGEEAVLGYEANVAEQISNQIDPPVVSTFSWSRPKPNCRKKSLQKDKM